MNKKTTFMTVMLYLAKEFRIPGQPNKKTEKPAACVVVFSNETGMLPDIHAVAREYGLHLCKEPLVNIVKAPADTYVYEFETTERDMGKATIVTKQARLSEDIPPTMVHCQGRPSRKVSVKGLLTINGTELPGNQTQFKHPKHIVNITCEEELVPTPEAVQKTTGLKAHKDSSYALLFTKDGHCIYTYEGLERDRAKGVTIT